MRSEADERSDHTHQKIERSERSCWEKSSVTDCTHSIEILMFLCSLGSTNKSISVSSYQKSLWICRITLWVSRKMGEEFRQHARWPDSTHNWHWPPPPVIHTVTLPVRLTVSLTRRIGVQRSRFKVFNQVRVLVHVLCVVVQSCRRRTTNYWIYLLRFHVSAEHRPGIHCPGPLFCQCAERDVRGYRCRVLHVWKHRRTPIVLLLGTDDLMDIGYSPGSRS